MQPALSVSQVGTRSRASNQPLFLQGNQGSDPAQFLTRGPLAARAHRLLGLGATGSARLGQSQSALRDAFGGDVASWGQVGTPWIAARSLARQVETLPSQSSISWLLHNT
ncbi:MAG: hypothetical protein JWM98_717 [Thermoleophilia bacterium]|nr:hypothetical protein [Thermoleophilia bacterium]